MSPICPSTHMPINRSRGFTLVELAIVLVVIGLLIGIGVSMIGPLTKRAKLIETREAVKQAKEAVLGYAVKNGYLPADLETAGARKLDAWGRDILLYRASEIDASPENACGVTATSMVVRECTSSDCSTYNTKSNIAFIVYSIGEDANGAGTGASSPFYVRIQGSPYTDAGNNYEYDDVVLYVSLDEIRTGMGCPQPLAVSSPAALTEGEEDSFYSYSMAAIGGKPPYTWNTGTQPGSGIALNSSGLISGVINVNSASSTGELTTCTGSISVTTSVTDTAGSAAVPYNGTIPVRPKPLTITTQTLPAGTENAAYSATLSGSGGRSSYTWTLTAGSLPPGLNLSSGGVISGTVSNDANTTGEQYNFTVQLSDTCTTVSKSFTITISDDDSPVTNMPICTLTANPDSITPGLTSTLTWSINNGPADGSFSPTSGTCTSFTGSSGGNCTTAALAATTTFTLTVTNAQGTSNCSATVYVGPPTTIPPSCTLQASPNPVSIGNPTTLIWNISNGPADGSFSPTSGGCTTFSNSYGGNCATANISSNTTFQLTVSNANGNGLCATTVYTGISGVCTVPSITNSSLPNGRSGLAYTSTTLSGSGGVLPYTWSWTGNPPGLTLNTSTGVISGTPTTPGVYTPTVTLTDSCPTGQQTTNRNYTIAIGRYDTYNVRNLTGGSIRVRGGQYAACTLRSNNQTFGVRRVDTSSVSIYTNAACTTPASLSSVSYSTVIPVDEAGDRDGNVRINASWSLVDE